jgi:hypothetical protein
MSITAGETTRNVLEEVLLVRGGIPRFWYTPTFARIISDITGPSIEGGPVGDRIAARITNKGSKNVEVELKKF